MHQSSSKNFHQEELNTDGVNWLKKLHQTLIVKKYGMGTICNYCQEMTLLFKHYNVKPLSKITQALVNSAMAKAGFKEKPFTAHTLRHSFATHMLNQGNNIHVIKTLPRMGWIKEKRSNGRFLFPRRAMEKIYKGYFLKQLRKYITGKSLFIEDEEALENILSAVGQKKWNVYAKAPFGGPAQIIEYLGRYTHKMAITAHRILKIDEQQISFRYKDYQDGHKQKIMTLSHEEFLRRFEQHILPKGFVKIRHAVTKKKVRKPPKEKEASSNYPVSLNPASAGQKAPISKRTGLFYFIQSIFNLGLFSIRLMLYVRHSY